MDVTSSGIRPWSRARKTTVEECLGITIADFPGSFRNREFGKLALTWPSGNETVVRWLVTEERGPVLKLRYLLRNIDDVSMSVQLQTTPTQFGGKRWWFECPLKVNGIPCRRRAGKLLLPLTSRFFGCRKCHDLSYRSSQEAHAGDRLIATLAQADGLLDFLRRELQ